jgi:hypothetical protein
MKKSRQRPLINSSTQTTTEDWRSLRGPSYSHVKQQQKNYLERCFLCGPCRGYITVSSCDYERESLEVVQWRRIEVGAIWTPARESKVRLSLEAAVTRLTSRKLAVNVGTETMDTNEGTADWEDSVRATVNCRVWELEIALVVTNCKCSINQITNPNPIIVTHTHGNI